MTGDEILKMCRPIVLQVSRGLAYRFPSVDVDDCEQAAWVWCLQNKRRLAELLENPGAMTSFMAADVKRELYKLGHGHDPHRIYTNSEMKAFLGRVLHPDWRARVVPEWEPVAQLLEDAYGRLSDKDQEVLALHCREEMNHTAIGNALGVSRQAAERRVNRAMARLQSEFERPDREEEDGHWSDRNVGTKVSMRNAHARAVIANHHNGDEGREPNQRLGGMRRIDE